MPSHSEGPGVWLSVWRFLLTHCLYERAAKVLVILRGCAGSPEPSLLAQAISTKFAWRGPIVVYLWHETEALTNHVIYNVFHNNWAASWQNQQNGVCAQRRLRSAWTSTWFKDSGQRRLWSSSPGDKNMSQCKTKTYKVIWAPSKDSDQPGHPHDSKILIRLSGYASWHESSWGTHGFVGSKVSGTFVLYLFEHSIFSCWIWWPFEINLLILSWANQVGMAPSRHDWKIVDWDVKPQHKQNKVGMAKAIDLHE